jgi:hypothetical protein
MGILVASGGVPETVAALAAEQSIPLSGIAPQQVIAQNAAPDLSERSMVTKYPIVCVLSSIIRRGPLRSSNLAHLRC